MWLDAQGLVKQSGNISVEMQQNVPLLAQDGWYQKMRASVEMNKKQLRFFTWSLKISCLYTLIVLTILVLPVIEIGVRMLIGDIMLSIFGLVTLIISACTAVRFYKLKKQKHTINFNTCTLITTLLFNLSFVATEIFTVFLQMEVKYFYDHSLEKDSSNRLSADKFEEHMTKLNTRDIIYISMYFLL